MHAAVRRNGLTFPAVDRNSVLFFVLRLPDAPHGLIPPKTLSTPPRPFAIDLRAGRQTK